jgi:hypothetical protein
MVKNSHYRTDFAKHEKPTDLLATLEPVDGSRRRLYQTVWRCVKQS